jgi:hypothetical protein
LSGSGAEELYGTWRLLGAKARDAATGERSDFFGESPTGFLSYARDGRMSAILAMSERSRSAGTSRATDAERAALFDTFAAYAGTFTVEGGRVTHHVDVSWNEEWTGTDQVRYFRIEGDLLHITSDAQPSGPGGRIVVPELTWERVRPSSRTGR